MEPPLACMISRATRMTAITVGVATATSKRDVETVPAWVVDWLVVVVVVCVVLLVLPLDDDPGRAKTLTVTCPVIVSGSMVVPLRRPTLTTRSAMKLDAV